MFQTIVIAMLMYLVLVTTPSIVIGALQVVMLVCLCFFLVEAVTMLNSMRKRRKADNGG